jgi:cytochrome c oxidase subunit 4
MANADSEHSADHHEGLNVRAYLVVFVALSVFTAISFVVNGAVRSESLAPHMGFAIILSVAVIKAVLVGLYFMHLILDWGKFYFLIFPAFILGAMMLVVFLPDMVLGWHYFADAPFPPTKP